MYFIKSVIYGKNFMRGINISKSEDQRLSVGGQIAARCARRAILVRQEGRCLARMQSSQACCMFIQSRAGIFVTSSKAMAMSEDMEASPWMMSRTMLSGTLDCSAKLLTGIAISCSFSSSISPGWKAMSNFIVYSLFAMIICYLLLNL